MSMLVSQHLCKGTITKILYLFYVAFLIIQQYNKGLLYCVTCVKHQDLPNWKFQMSICSKMTIKNTRTMFMVSFQCFIVDFELVLHPVLIFILLTYFYYLNKCWFGYMLMHRATLNVAAEAILGDLLESLVNTCVRVHFQQRPAPQHL